MVITLWFVDAILFKATNFGVDGILKQNVFDEFKFSDVHLQDVLHLEEGPRLDFGVDAQVLRRPNNDSLVDAFLQEDDNEFGFTVDANAQIMPSQNYECDAFLEQETDHNFAVDSIVVAREPLFWDADTIISSRLLTTFTIDPITVGSLDFEYDLDSYLQEQDKETTFTLDSSPDRRVVPLVDAFIIAFNQEVTPAVDAILIVRKELTFQVDASLQKDGFQPFNVDAYVQADDNDFGYSVDGIIALATGTIDICTVHLCTPTQPVDFFGVDGIIIQSILHEFNLDAFLREDIIGLNFSVDAFVTLATPHTFAVDASIVRLSVTNFCQSFVRKSLNCQSFIRGRGLG